MHHRTPPAPPGGGSPAECRHEARRLRGARGKPLPPEGAAPGGSCCSGGTPARARASAVALPTACALWGPPERRDPPRPGALLLDCAAGTATTCHWGLVSSGGSASPCMSSLALCVLMRAGCDLWSCAGQQHCPLHCQPCGAPPCQEGSAVGGRQLRAAHHDHPGLSS